MSATTRPFAIVTGASSGIGFDLARCAAQAGYDLLIAADEPQIDAAATALRTEGVTVEAMQIDLASPHGAEYLYAAADRPVDVLLANAGRGLGGGFLDQDLERIHHVIDTNVMGTINLIHRVAGEMRDRGEGKILITGSIAGLMPGTFQAIYNGTKAFLDSFSYALRAELEDSGVTVTCLMPGATETEFFGRAEMPDATIGTEKWQRPTDVAKAGFEAMLRGEGEVVTGWSNKLRAAISQILPSATLAERHRKPAPGTAKHS